MTDGRAMVAKEGTGPPLHGRPWKRGHRRAPGKGQRPEPGFPTGSADQLLAMLRTSACGKRGQELLLCVCVHTCARKSNLGESRRVPRGSCTEGRWRGARARTAAPASLPGLSGCLSSMGLAPSPNSGSWAPGLPGWCVRLEHGPTRAQPRSQPHPSTTGPSAHVAGGTPAQSPPRSCIAQQSEGTLWRSPWGEDGQGWGQSRSREP